MFAGFSTRKKAVRIKSGTAFRAAAGTCLWRDLRKKPGNLRSVGE
jgi:hypothetical protein